MQAFRKYFIAVGVLLILAGGFSAWRASNPPQSEEQILLSTLDDAASAIQDRSVARVSKFLAPSFSWNGTSRSELKQVMTGAFWQWRDVQLQLTNQQVTVNGDEATTSGRFILNYRPAQDAAPESNSGNFTLQWRKADGQWQVVSATGADNMR